MLTAAWTVVGHLVVKVLAGLFVPPHCHVHSGVGGVGMVVASAVALLNFCMIGLPSSTAPADLKNGNAPCLFAKPPAMKPPSVVNAIDSKPDLLPMPASVSGN